MDSPKKVTDKQTRCGNEYGLGKIEAEFTAFRYDGDPLLDTTVELKIDRFAITWKQREAFLDALQEVIERFQI